MIKPGSILHVCDFPNVGGGNFVPSQFELALLTRRELGIGTHFVFPEESREAEWIGAMTRRGVGVSLIDRTEPRRGRARRIRRIAEERQAILVHSHFTYFDLDCAWATSGLGARLVWHMHSGISTYTPGQRAKDVLKVRLIGRACDRVIACAPWIGEQAVERGFPRKKVQVVQNGIVLDRFAEDALPDKITARRRFAIDPTVSVILAFCWAPEIKGADVLLEASHRLATRDAAPILLILVGGEALESYVDERGERPPWLRLMRSVDDVPTLLRAADIFVNASRNEGMAYAIAEAMAAARPVIASDIPGSAAYTSAPGLTCFQSENPEALHLALAESLNEDLAERGRLNRDFVFERFSIDHYSHAILEIYQELLNGV
jgi:glycosyltransferase involved in cell wall biosynthesis